MPKLSLTRGNKFNSRKNIMALIIMIIVTAIFLYPFFIMLFVSLKSAREALLSPNTFPRDIRPENYLNAWKIMKFHQPFFNSVLVTATGVGGVVVAGGMAAFILAKSKSRIAVPLYFFFVAGIMIPFYTSLIPIVKIMTNLGLTDSRIGLAIAYAGRAMPMGLFMFYGFIKGTPDSIIESAVIDGAGKWKTYWSIVFPLMRPITTTVIILKVLWFWNDFLFPMLMLTTPGKRTIPLTQYYFSGEYGTQWELAFASYIIAMLPVLILYIFGQKNIISGISAGAVKG
ncbi:MAG: carbohydrate ABC transporter permease [Spirochaetales bacterium]|nr:carbohydrate ABC transporter permease [Spirochaetales bacterium]